MMNGAESYSISAVGEDELGDELAMATEKAGIHTVLQRNAWPTGTVEVALRNGIPEYTIVPNVAWDHGLVMVVTFLDCCGWLLRCAQSVA